MAKKFEKTTVSEEPVELEMELETETAGGSGNVPPAKATTTGRSGDGSGGRRPSKSTAAPGLFERLAQFVRDTRAEMRRVTWPTLVMVRNTTIITLIAVVFFALYLFAVDKVWAFLIGYLRTWLGG